MHTPEQAKELWCPMVRIGVTQNHGGPSAVNDPTTQYRGNCIADKCAMWRWAEEPKQVFLTKTANEETYTTVMVKERGYCGLAPVHGVGS